MNSSHQIKPFRYVSYLVCAIILHSTGIMHAQELSNIGKSPLLTVNGGLSLNQVYFNSDDTLALRDPYAYTLMANINFALYGWSIPLSAVYSNQKWSYHQPFNQFTLTPSYKWVRLYLGNSSMSFSPYTLNGHQFLGAGVELTPPGKFKFSAMGGRLQKRILPDTLNLGEPTYMRAGGGFKTEYALDFGNIALMAFYARDDKNSFPSYIDTLPISPEENFVIGLSGNFTVLRNINLNVDYAVSTLSEDINSPITSKGYNNLPFFPAHESTSQFQAIKAGVNYNTPYGALGLGIERVDPGYRTLGSYYSNNDFVNYTINYGGSMLKNKISLAASYGLQKDNLLEQKDQETKRTVGNVNLSVNPIEKLNIALFYSNFNNFTNIKTTFEDINNTNPYGNLDTLDFTQISESIGGSANYNFGNKEKTTHTLNFTLSYQQASQIQADNPSQAGTSFYTAMGGYNLKRVPLDLSPGLMMNYNRSMVDSIITDIYGPSFNLRKSFFDKKLNASAMISFNKTLTDKKTQNSNTMLRASASYTLQKKHMIDLSLIHALRRHKTMGKRNETTITLTYRYNFNWSPAQKTNTSNPMVQP